MLSSQGRQLIIVVRAWWVQLKAMERQWTVGEKIRAVKQRQLAQALATLDAQAKQAAADLAAARNAMQAALAHP